jgi:hypothetical protein
MPSTFLKSESLPISNGRPTQFFLTTVGNGTGVYNQNIDYSATPTDIFYTATAVYDIYTFLVVISDHATFNQTDYGAIAGGLTNGIKVFIQPAGQAEIPLLSGVAFKQNFEWLSITEHTQLSSFAGLAQTLTVAFDITVDYGKPINMAIGDKFIIRLNDDFTGLVSHTFGLRGIKY